jgi:membrane protein
MSLFAFLCLIFTVMFKVLPEARLTWRDVLPGAVFTALVYMLGRGLAAHYLARFGGASASDVSVSLLIFLLWIYYTSQVFLFGAEFTRLYTERYGSLRRPEGREGGF